VWPVPASAAVHSRRVATARTDRVVALPATAYRWTGGGVVSEWNTDSEGRGARQGGRGGDLPKWRGINEGHGAWTGDGVPSPVRSSGGHHRRGTVLQHRGMEGEVRCTENQIHSPRRSSSPRRGRFWWRRLQLQRGGGSSTTGLDKR
jgi:hypothetical protein